MEDQQNNKPISDTNSTRDSFIKFKEKSIEEFDLALPYIKKYGFLLLILIPLFIGVYLRSAPFTLPITDSWARDTILNNLRNDFANKINQQNPNLPDANKNAILNEQLNKFLSDNAAQYDVNIHQLSSQFRSYLQDDNGTTYMVGIDPYFWARHARNIIRNGYPGDFLKNGVPYDNYMLAPIGREVPPDMFPAYFDAYFYEFLHFFNKNISLEYSMLFNQAILIGLATIIAFLLGRRIAGNTTGFFAALTIAMHTAILVRTTGSFADSDPYQILVPLLIIWLFLESFNTSSRPFKIVLPILTGLSIGFYNFVWGGWWYIFLYVIAAGGIYLVYYFSTSWKSAGIKNIFKNTEFSRVLFTLSIIMVVAVPTMIYYSGVDEITQLAQRVVGFIQIHDVGSTYVWPNVYITVAEQNEGSIQSAISSVGGTIFFYFSLIGIILPLLFKKVRETNNINIKSPIIILIWLATTLWAVTRGVRFTLMMVPPIAIGFGMSISILSSSAQKLIKYLDVYNNWYKYGSMFLSVLIGLMLLGMLPYQSNGMWSEAKKIAFYGASDMDDAWWKSLENIRLNSSPNAIITSWWDFGHWFKYIADRSVTFDGTSQNNPQAHWVGLILATNNEKYAAGILRMLDCGATLGFDKLNEPINDIAKTKDIIDPMFTMNKEQARAYLQTVSKQYPNKIFETDIILNYTHCDPPEAFFITSTDMISKAAVWGHFGLWDFNKSLMYNELLKEEYKGNADAGIKFLENRFSMSADQAQQTYYELTGFTSKDANDWISPWPIYQSYDNVCTPSENRTVITCPQGITFNFTQLPYTININNNPNLSPYSLVYPTSNGTGEQFYNQASSVSLAVYQRPDNSTRYLIAPKQLVNGMFSRMFFMNGVNLNYFKLFSYQKSFTGTEIYVWRVNWGQLKQDEQNG